MNRYRLAEQAKLDLGEMWLFVEKRSRRGARRLLDELHARFSDLADSPGLGPACEQFGADWRKSIVGKYVIFYRPVAEGIEVLRILHGARNIEALLRETEEEG